MYTLKILSDQDFDKLPYKHAKTSLGAADAKTGVAFVRDTGYNDVTKATISHELDELVNKTSPHEQDGIRYKSLASYGAGAGAGALSSLIPGLKNFSPAIAAGAGALANRKGQPWKGALQGFTGGGAGSSLLGGAGGAIKGLSQPGGTFGKAVSGFLPGIKQAGLDYAGAIPGFGGIGTDQPTGKIAQAFQGFGSGGGTGNIRALDTPIDVAGGGQIIGARDMRGVGNIPAQPARGALDIAASQDAAKQGGLGGIFDQFKDKLPGAGVAILGDLLAPKVDAPDFSGIGDKLRGELQAGTLGDPEARGLGMTELRRVLGEGIGNVPDTAFNLGDIENQNAKQKALGNYVNQWKSIRPGADFSNDPEFQRGYSEIEEQYDRVRAAQRDQQSFEYNQQQLQQKYNYMVQALGLDQYQMNQYIELAQLDVNQLMLEYGLSVDESNRFKALFSDLGQGMMRDQRQGDALEQILAQLKQGGGQ